jgi:hypothetical protein
MELIALLVLAVVLVGPILAAVITGLRRRDVASPREQDTGDAAAYAQIARDLRDTQNDGRGW